MRVHLAVTATPWRVSKMTSPWAVPTAIRPHSVENPIELTLAGGDTWIKEDGRHTPPHLTTSPVDCHLSGGWPFHVKPSCERT